jgi:hypothetical protein
MGIVGVVGLLAFEFEPGLFPSMLQEAVVRGLARANHFGESLSTKGLKGIVKAVNVIVFKVNG